MGFGLVAASLGYAYIYLFGALSVVISMVIYLILIAKNGRTA